MDNAKKSIALIVDDSQVNIDMLNAILQGHYDVKFALNGEKALEIASKEPHPDIILLDVMMPEMNGYEVCTLLKKDEATSHIPVIFVTALNEREEELTGFKVGGEDYITKPFTPEIVLARVKTHVELKEVKDKLVEYSKRLEKMLDDKLNL